MSADSGVIRKFDTGATRDTATNKPDYAGYLSSLVLAEYGRYMLKHSIQPDGTQRASDNWKNGIPFDVYLSSQLRHTFQLWQLHDGFPVYDWKTGDPITMKDALCGMMFNTMGYFHELLMEEMAGDDMIEQALPDFQSEPVSLQPAAAGVGDSPKPAPLQKLKTFLFPTK